MNHYDVLEVSPKASGEVIRAAYKSLMQRHHPDKSPDTGASGERASLIAQAYEVLSNPDKRLAYDREVLRSSLAGSAPGSTEHPGAFRAVGRPRQPKTKTDSHTWYAWLLIVCITAAGAMILVLSKKTAAPAPAATPYQSAAAPDAETRAVGLAAVRPDARAGPSADGGANPQARTIPAFVTHLSINLTPSDPASGRLEHVLHIPDLGLRVAAGESERWVQKIEGQRPALLQQLLARLANASYDELVKADGDLYLKRLIEQTLSEGVGLEPATHSNAAAPGQAPQRPLEALLPQAYSVR
jgi:curved DNA-binding protein CbpA